MKYKYELSRIFYLKVRDCFLLKWFEARSTKCANFVLRAIESMNFRTKMTE